MGQLRRRRFRQRSHRSSWLLTLFTLVLVGLAGAIGTGLARALRPPNAPGLSHEFLAVEAIGDEFAGREALEQDLLGSPPPQDFLTAQVSPSFAPDLPPPDPDGTVDPVPTTYWLGRDLYREACGTCHVAIPPEVLPIQTWQELLVSEQHYGKVIQPLPRGTVNIAWKYIRDYSRTLRQEEEIPFRLDKSRFFRSLHPNVPFPEPVRVAQCATCHPRAEFFNFRLFNDAKQPS